MKIRDKAMKDKTVCIKLFCKQKPLLKNAYAISSRDRWQAFEERKDAGKSKRYIFKLRT